MRNSLLKRIGAGVLAAVIIAACCGWMPVIFARTSTWTDLGFYSYTINDSMRIANATGNYLEWTPTVDADSNYIWTFSCWLKRGTMIDSNMGVITAGSSSTHRGGVFVDTGLNKFGALRYNSGSVILLNRFNPLVRDPAHWMHVLFRLDSTQSTGADRTRLWLNGVEVQHDSNNNLTQNVGLLINLNGFTNRLAQNYSQSNAGWDGHIAEVYMVDGLVVDVSEFGEFIGNTWVPKKYAGSYGTNGYYLNFADSGDLGKDVSGNGNHWTTYGDCFQSQDTPTNNFVTLDPLGYGNAGAVLESGLKFDTTVASLWRSGLTTIPLPSEGKWQIEYAVATLSAANYHHAGVVPETYAYDGYIGNVGAAYGADGRSWLLGTDTAEGDSWETAVCGIVYDGDADTASFYVDGVFQFTKSCAGFDGSQRFFGFSQYGQTADGYINNGAEGFDYPISGARPLCTEYLPTPSITDSDDGLWIPTWAGDQVERDITGSSFSIAGSNVLAWIKSRTSTSYHHLLLDTVRGMSSALHSNNTDAEDDPGIYGYAEAIANGITLKEGSSGWHQINANSNNYVGWAFNMLPQYGMDIVEYTGTGISGNQISHNLGAEPELIIIKRLDGAVSWIVGCEYLDASLPWNYYLMLDSSNARAAASGAFNATAPTSSVFTVGNVSSVNGVGDHYIAYLFRSVPGFLKVGYYTGNNNADGPREYTDFRPRYLLVKRTDALSGWFIHDSERAPNNLTLATIRANDVTAEDSTSAAVYVDFLSNGFKIRAASAYFNGNNGRHIYLAIGDAFPYVNTF